MAQDLSLKVPTLERLPAMLKAAKELGAVKVEVTAYGTWREVGHGKNGDLVFGPFKVLGPLRGGRRVRVQVDGQTIVVEPWLETGMGYDYKLYLKLVF